MQLKAQIQALENARNTFFWNSLVLYKTGLRERQSQQKVVAFHKIRVLDIFTSDMIIFLQTFSATEPGLKLMSNIQELESTLYNYLYLHSIFQTTESYLNSNASVIYNPQIQYFGEIYNQLLTTQYYNFSFGTGIKYQLRLIDVYKNLTALHKQESNQTKKDFYEQMITKLKKFDADKNIIQYMEDKIIGINDTLNKYIHKLEDVEKQIIADLSGSSRNSTQTSDSNKNGSSTQLPLDEGEYKYYFLHFYKELGLSNYTNINRSEIGFDSVLPCSNLYKNVIIIIDRWPDFSQIDRMILQSATKNDRIWFYYDNINIVEEYANQSYLELQTYIYVKDYLNYVIQAFFYSTNKVINKKDIQDLVTQIENHEQTTILVQEKGKSIVKSSNSLLLIFVNDIYLIYNSYDILQFNKDVVSVIFTNYMHVQSYNILRTQNIYFYHTEKDLNRFLQLINQKYYIQSVQFQTINTNVVFCKSIVRNNEYIGSVYIIQPYYKFFYQVMNIWPDSVSVIQVAFDKQVLLNSELQYFQPSVSLNEQNYLIPYQVIPVKNGYQPLNISISNVIQERFLREYYLSAEDKENYYEQEYQTLYYNKYVNQLQITVMLSQYTILTTDRITIKQFCKDLTKDQFISQLAAFQTDAQDLETVAFFASPSHTYIKKYCLNKTGRVCQNTEQQSFEYTNKITNMVQRTINNSDSFQCSYPGLPEGFYYFNALYLLMKDKQPANSDHPDNAQPVQNTEINANNHQLQNIKSKAKLLLNGDDYKMPGLDEDLKLGNATECFTDFLRAVKALLYHNNSTEYDSIIYKYKKMLTNDIDQQFDFTYYILLKDGNTTKRIESFMQEIPDNQTVYLPHMFLYLDNVKNEILYFKNMAYLHQHYMSTNSKFGNVYLSHNYQGSYQINIEQAIKKYCRRLLIEYQLKVLNQINGSNGINLPIDQADQQVYNQTLYQLREQFAMRYATFTNHMLFMFTNDNNATRRYLVSLQQVGSHVDGLFGQYRLAQIDNTYYVSKPIIVTNKNINGLQQINGYTTVSLTNVKLDTFFNDQTPFIFFSTTGQILKTNIDDTNQLTLVKYIVIQQLLRIRFLTSVQIRYTSYNYNQFYKINDEFWNNSWVEATVNKTFTIFLYRNKSTDVNKDVFYRLLSEFEYNKTNIWERVIVVESTSNFSIVSRFSIHLPRILQGFMVYFEDGLLSVPKDQNLSFIYDQQEINHIKNTHAAVNGEIQLQFLNYDNLFNSQRNYIYSINMTFLPTTDPLIYDKSIIYLIITIAFTALLISAIYQINKYFSFYVEKKRLPLMELLNDAEKNKKLQELYNKSSEIDGDTDYDRVTTQLSNDYMGTVQSLEHPRDNYTGTEIDAPNIQYLFRRDYITNLRGGQHLQKQVLKPNNLFTILCYDKKDLSSDESFQVFLHVVDKVRMQEALKAPYPQDYMRKQLKGYEPQPVLAAKYPERIGNFIEKKYPTCDSRPVKKQFKLPPVQRQIPLPKFYDFEFQELFEREDNYTPLDVTVYQNGCAMRYHNMNITEVDKEYINSLQL